MEIEEILLKQLNKKKLTVQEQSALRKWLLADKRNRKAYNQMKLMLLASSNKTQDVERQVWKDINRKIDHKVSTEVPASTFMIPHWAKVAAVLLVTFSLALVALLYQSQPAETLVVEKAKWIEKVSMPGQKISVTLPDGTKVKLNAGSTLLAPESFDGDTREVTLSGEAFFDVARDEQKPFIIRSHSVDVQVLGTSFNVKSYPQEEEVKVSVATGKVAVVDKENSRIKEELVPGQQANYKNGQLSTSTYDWEETMGWRENLLVFKDDNLKDILSELSKWYGVEFLMKKSFDNKRDYSGKYKNATIQSVLKGLAYVYQFEYTIENNIITIK
ncbi:MAG: FecR domain-containing protein [Cyclobacteriaceae bacterium]|nr:FecR domain-containing protein [Cyclobacteriaceae bacterium HetDA_MAG_MS6]